MLVGYGPPGDRGQLPSRPRDETPVNVPLFSNGRLPAGRRRTALVALILIAAVLLGTAFRVDSMRHKHGLHVDEVISYIAAAGRIGDFSHPGATTLYGHWVPAAQWKSGLGPGPVFNFGKIVSGLARHDVHPPLYFIVLHLWTLVVGVRFWSGPSLNLIIDVLAGAALFGLARRLLRDPVAAALVVLIWSVSPAVRLTSSMARMYSLEALFSVLFVWLLVAVTDRTQAPARPLLSAALLALATAGGMLTQYQFVLIVAGGIAYVLLRLVRFDRRRCVRALLSIAVGLVVVWLVEPGVFAQFRRQSATRPEAFSLPLLQNKLNGTAGTVFDFFGLGVRRLHSAAARPLRLWGLLPGAHLSVLVLLTFWTCVAVALTLTLPWSRRWLVRRDWTGGVALVFLVWIGGTIVAQNLAFLSEPRVLSARYLAVAWPFLAFVPVLVSRALLPRWPYVVAAVFCLGFMVPLSLAPVNYAAWSGPLPKLSQAQRVVIDCPGSAALPLTVWWLPRDALVYADNWRDLQARPAAWLDQLQSGAFIVHGDDIPPDALRDVRTRFVIAEVPPHFRQFSVYRVGTRHSGG